MVKKTILPKVLGIVRDYAPKLAKPKKVSEKVPISKLALHFHDTRGLALANIFACLELGITVIDTSIAGLGGCSYANGASGNVATEDVVYMLDGMNIETGIDLMKLIETGHFISSFFALILQRGGVYRISCGAHCNDCVCERGGGAIIRSVRFSIIGYRR